MILCSIQGIYFASTSPVIKRARMCPIMSVGVRMCPKPVGARSFLMNPTSILDCKQDVSVDPEFQGGSNATTVDPPFSTSPLCHQCRQRLQHVPKIIDGNVLCLRNLKTQSFLEFRALSNGTLFMTGYELRLDKPSKPREPVGARRCP